MKRILIAFVLGGLLAAALFACLNYHFILTKDELAGRKQQLSFKDTFVSTRGWGPADYLRHPRISLLVARHKAGGKGIDTPEAALEKTKKALDDELEKVQKELRR